MPDEEFVGRMLLASLHQAVGEVLPARLGFYEDWLTPDAAPGVASFMAMLTSLQQEGEAFDLISSRAGHYAAVRSFQELSPLKRAGLRMLPRGMRARRAVHLLTRILASLYPETRIDTTRRLKTFFVGIYGSPFCAVRRSHEPAACSFYSSSIATFLRLFNLHPSVRVRGCQSMGMRGCLLMVLPDEARSAAAESGVLGLADDVMIPPSLEVAGPREIAPAIQPQVDAREADDLIVDTVPTSVDVPISDAAPTSEAATVTETADASEPPPVPETVPVLEPLVSDTIPAPETAPGGELAPPPEAAITDAAPEPSAAAVQDVSHSPEVPSAATAESAPAAPNVAVLWDTILAKRTRPPGSIRLNLGALFARPASGVDAEAAWHRLKARD